MLGNLFTTLLIEPIYNTFVFFLAVLPGHSAGLAIIALTLLIRIVFFPTFSQATRTQHAMRRIEGKLEAIKKEHKDAATRGQKTMELLREHKIRPFMSLLALLIQLPVFIALYTVFLREGFPEIAQQLLYGFTPIPAFVTVVFLGILDLTLSKNMALAVIVAAVQYAQSRIAAGEAPDASLPPERAQMLMVQRNMLLYFFPFFMGFIAYTLPAAAGLYLLTNAVISVVQDVAIKRSLKKETAATA